MLEIVCPRVLTRRKFCNVGKIRTKDGFLTCVRNDRIRMCPSTAHFVCAQDERFYISRYTPTLTLPPPIEGEGNNFEPFDRLRVNGLGFGWWLEQRRKGGNVEAHYVRVSVALIGL